MSELCRRGRELLQELKSYDRFTLSPFNEEIIRLIFQEIEEHDGLTKEIVAKFRQQQENIDDPVYDGVVATTLCAHYESIKRNKRCLLIYMAERMERLKAFRWELRRLPEDQASRCCPQELQFYSEYDKVLTSYMSKEEGVGMDLTLDCVPPKDSLVTVRGLRDIGERIFSFGAVQISRGGLFHLPLDEAEPLIRAGDVAQVQWSSGFL
uniref:GINS subunit domain-containing protein n=1 Tax=Polytomella parva TaxID=51329 RepID=A0A7S0YKN5_9CHLO|mmetsp:Transcript_31229/g.56693  ORF Transcript_31229/g.56693 Transcript_31229/m.56693 type:complete len:209 (+) Transcript_31229:89-715(+)